jgi:hypothetical protein
MAPMRCNEFRQVSSEWMEGEHSPAAASHMEACARCRALIADLEMIRHAGSLFPLEEPPARVWTAIKSQLQKEGLIRTLRPAWWERFASFGTLRPALAGVYLTVVIAGAIALSTHVSTTSRSTDQAVWLQRTQNSMNPLAAELSTAETKALPALHAEDTDVTATLNRNLAIVDNLISMCEKSVREDPQNEMTRDYLYTAYQQKASLLATMAESAGQ